MLIYFLDELQKRKKKTYRVAKSHRMDLIQKACKPFKGKKAKTKLEPSFFGFC